jgi:hypothetical protein
MSRQTCQQRRNRPSHSTRLQCRHRKPCHLPKRDRQSHRPVLKIVELTTEVARLKKQASTLQSKQDGAAAPAATTGTSILIAILAGTDKDFPLIHWCKLLEQATVTVNLLRSSRLHPQLSAQAALNGAFDCTRTPLAPLGIKVIAHDKPSERGSWAPHGTKGWHVGFSSQHCRCWRMHLLSLQLQDPRSRKTQGFWAPLPAKLFSVMKFNF